MTLASFQKIPFHVALPLLPGFQNHFVLQAKQICMIGNRLSPSNRVTGYLEQNIFAAAIVLHLATEYMKATLVRQVNYIFQSFFLLYIFQPIDANHTDGAFSSSSRLTYYEHMLIIVS